MRIRLASNRLWVLVIAAPWVLGMRAALAADAGVTVTTTLGDQPPVTVSLVTPFPDPVENLVRRDLDDGNNTVDAEAKVVNAPIPVVSGMATVATSASGHPFARAEIDVHLRFGVSLAGPDPQTVAPILVHGRTRIDAAPNATLSTSLEYDGGALSALTPISGNPLVGAPGIGWVGPDCAPTCVIDEAYTFGSTIANIGGLPVNLAITAHLDIQVNDYNKFASAALMIDPFIELLPEWALANPEYSLVLEPGIGNTRPVPLPGAFPLVAAALIALMRMRRACNARAVDKRLPAQSH